MIKVTFIVLGKLKEKYLFDASAEYIKRLSRFCDIKTEEISPESLPDNPSEKEIEKALLKESEKIISKIPVGAYVTALCVEGEQISSEEFAKEIKQAEEKGRPLCFIIGSSYGLDAAVKNAADKKLSFSKMTFPHQLFRVMMLEQLYRAFKINGGGTYHK